jgi:hypothetical protein
MFSPSKRKQGLGYHANGEIKANPSQVSEPAQNGGKNGTKHLYVIVTGPYVAKKLD